MNRTFDWLMNPGELSADIPFGESAVHIARVRQKSFFQRAVYLKCCLVLIGHREIIHAVIRSQQAELLLHQRHCSVFFILLQILRLGVGNADRTDFSFPDQFLQGAHGFLHRPAFAYIVNHQHINIIRLHTN